MVSLEEIGEKLSEKIYHVFNKKNVLTGELFYRFMSMQILKINHNTTNNERNEITYEYLNRLLIGDHLKVIYGLKHDYIYRVEDKFERHVRQDQLDFGVLYNNALKYIVEIMGIAREEENSDEDFSELIEKVINYVGFNTKDKSLKNPEIRIGNITNNIIELFKNSNSIKSLYFPKTLSVENVKDLVYEDNLSITEKK